MICSICGGHVTWRGPLTALMHTQCESCGESNCQEVADEVRDDLDEQDDMDLQDYLESQP